MYRLCLGLLVSASLILHVFAAEPSSQLLNPDFEEDADNVGFPDGWKVSPGAAAALTEVEPTSGRRALEITGGYAAVYQDLDVSNLAGRRVALHFDARSLDGSTVGVRIGFYIRDEAKGKIWRDLPMVWDKALKTDYQTFTATRTIPEDALDGRFWICFYRCKKEGTVVVDNISLELLDGNSTLGARESVILQREKDYFSKKLRLAAIRQPANPDWASLAADLNALLKKTHQSEAPDKAFQGALASLQVLNARLLGALFPSQSFTAGWTDAFERLNPETIPAATGETWKAMGLPGEVISLGVEIANTTKDVQTLSLSVVGAPSTISQIQARRQVMMETWYTKGATLIADPLTLLEKEGDGWKLVLEPGETTRLYLALKVNPASADGHATGALKLTSALHEESLPFEIQVLGPAAPTKPALAHYQFLYTSLNVANSLPSETSEDLEAHGVTDIEWPFMPAAKFSSEGALLEVDWTRHDRWLAGFKNSTIRLNIFWQSSYPKMTTPGGVALTVLSPEWKRAFKELLTAYLDRAAAMGIPRERFTILPMDEIHSKHLDHSPDEKISRYVEVAQTIFEAEPGLPQYLTIGNYAFPPDIAKVLPFLNVAIPHWPRPERLSRNAPPEYEARQDYFEKTLPLLQEARRARGLQIWGYHVMSGKSDDLLTYSRAYPLLSVAAGLTGFGYWAYNVSSGSTWDDMDGKILDYCLIYDGTENHPINKKYNVTGENIVPSLQWEAIRAGQQDGQVLLHLMALVEKEECPADLAAEIKGVSETIRKIGGQYGYGGPDLSFAAIRKCAHQLREIYAKTATLSSL